VRSSRPETGFARLAEVDARDDGDRWYDRDERTQRLRGLLTSGCRLVRVELRYLMPGESEPRTLAWGGLDVIPQLPAFRHYVRGWELRSTVQVLDIRVEAEDLVTEADVARNPYVLLVH
jgi:hypothetical protein